MRRLVAMIALEPKNFGSNFDECVHLRCLFSSCDGFHSDYLSLLRCLRSKRVCLSSYCFQKALDRNPAMMSSACASCQSWKTLDDGCSNTKYRKTAVMIRLIIMCECNSILIDWLIVGCVGGWKATRTFEKEMDWWCSFMALSGEPALRIQWCTLCSVIIFFVSCHSPSTSLCQVFEFVQQIRRCSSWVMVLVSVVVGGGACGRICHMRPINKLFSK